MTEPHIDDWPARIGRLERHMKHIDIGAAVGRSESWVGQLKRGVIAEPPDSVAKMLRALDAEYCVSCETFSKPQDISVQG